jgi:excisionase family DNA binding protein
MLGLTALDRAGNRLARRTDVTKAQTIGTTARDPDLTIREVCAETGLSRATLYRYLDRPLSDGGLPVMKYGHAVRVSRVDLDTFKQARRTEQRRG